MSQELCHQQEALWELLTTELNYMQKLKIMTSVSLAQPRPAPPSAISPLPSHYPNPWTRRGSRGWQQTGNEEMPLI